MTPSLLTPPMRLAVQIRHGEPAGYRIRIGERAGDRASRNTLCGPAFPIERNLPAPFRSAVLSSRVSGWRATIEHTQPIALVARAISQGTRLICNLFGTLSARSSSLFPFVDHSREPTNGVFHTLKFPPVPFVAAAHDEQHATKEIIDVRKSFGVS